MGQRRKPTTCKHCGAVESDELIISWRGSCLDCAVERVAQPARELQAKSGPAYDAWRAAMQRAAERLS